MKKTHSKILLLIGLLLNKTTLFAQTDRGSYHQEDITGNLLSLDSSISFLIAGIVLFTFGYLILTKSKGSWGLIGVLFMIVAFVCIVPAFAILQRIWVVLLIIGFVILFLNFIFQNSKK